MQAEGQTQESIGSWNAIVEAFDSGEVDLSIDLWTKNVRRVQQAQLSEPLIYKRRSFLTSSANSNVQQTEMDILPLSWRVLVCFAAAAVLIAVVLAFAKVVQGGGGIRVFGDQLLLSIWKLCQVLGKQPVGLGKFNKSWSTTAAWFPWLFGGLLVAAMYDAVVTTELLPKVQLPFSDSLELAAKMKEKAFRLIVEDPSAPFYQLIETSNSPVYRALNASLQVYPKLVFSPQEVLVKLRENDHYVYAANTVAAKFIMGQECDLIEMEDAKAEYSGLNLAFPKNSKLPDIFRTTIVKMHSVIDRMIKEVGSSRCVKTNVEVQPMPIGYLLTAFFFLAAGCGVGMVLFFTEQPWKGKNQVRAVPINAPIDSVIVKEQEKWAS